VSPTALLALGITKNGHPEGHAFDDFEPWIEVLRGAIEADLASGEEIDGARQQARAMRGALGFLRYVASTNSVDDVAVAVIQACAVWFDADARLYRREGNGDYVLVAALPGAQVPADAMRLHGLSFAGSGLVRAGSVSDLRGFGGAREGLLVPIVTSGSAEWLLALIGVVPTDADVTMEALATVLGAQLERLAQRHSLACREQLDAIVARTDRPVELTALELLRALVVKVRGAGAALWVQLGSDLQRVALVGAAPPQVDAAPVDEARSTPTWQVRSFVFGGGLRGRLEVYATEDAPFETDAALVIDSCVPVLRAWLPSAARSVQEPPPMFAGRDAADFARRIEEELARAKRFDRRLSLVLIESSRLAADQASLERLLDLLRRELRNSDVLGVLNGERVVALLVETDGTAVGMVARRLRDRIGHAMPDLQLPRVSLGQAAYSDECTTAHALLSQAAVNAEAITQPA
jgi:hypothetical protein